MVKLLLLILGAMFGTFLAIFGNDIYYIHKAAQQLRKVENVHQAQ